jgi:hypothetical protein
LVAIIRRLAGTLSLPVLTPLRRLVPLSWEKAQPLTGSSFGGAAFFNKNNIFEIIGYNVDSFVFITDSFLAGTLNMKRYIFN